MSSALQIALVDTLGGPEDRCWKVLLAADGISGTENLDIESDCVDMYSSAVCPGRALFVVGSKKAAQGKYKTCDSPTTFKVGTRSVTMRIGSRKS